MYNTYFFVRPGPCLIEWYGCCTFDLLSLKVSDETEAEVRCTDASRAAGAQFATQTPTVKRGATPGRSAL